MKKRFIIVVLILLVLVISGCEEIPRLSGETEQNEFITLEIKKGNNIGMIEYPVHQYDQSYILDFSDTELNDNIHISVSREGEIYINDPNEKLSEYQIKVFDGYIIELSKTPLAKVKEDKRALQKRNLDIEHSSVKKILNKQNIKIEREFKKAFNGISIGRVSKDDLNVIKKIPNVKKIWPNYRVTTTLIDSTAMINADDMWLEGYTGQGVTIAIIDTGVDYTHPDLGGCLGLNCKVIGGYDFINEDSNPMDDHGHGTHVAGIAAGEDGNNVGLKGVAPDAKLYAYKVLSADGYGNWDDIISGIESAMDPNNDYDFSDYVNVISMSLGGWGNPDDPVSSAVDVATEVGVTSVIAAGNIYEYDTILSPGTARTAITVGAICKSFGDGGYCYSQSPIAGFSSKGPVWWYNDVLSKPDVVAPGVNICSSQWDDAWSQYECIDDEHTSISGTSMATPHVAGAAALLKQAHPSWGPNEIKSALMLNARELEFDDEADYEGIPNQFFQGTGLIDVLAAKNTRFLTDKTHITYSFESGENSATIPITIYNIDDEVLTLDLELTPAYDYFELLNNNEVTYENIVTSNTYHLNINPGNSETFEISITPGQLRSIFYGKIYITDVNSNKRHIVSYIFSKLVEVNLSIEDGHQYGNPASYFYLFKDDLTYLFESNSEPPNLTASFYVPGNENYLAIAFSSSSSEPDYLLYDTFSIGNEQQYSKELSIEDAKLFFIEGRSLNNKNLWSQYTKEIFLINDVGRKTSITFSDPIIGNHRVYLSKKPLDFPGEIDIIIKLNGIEYE